MASSAVQRTSSSIAVYLLLFTLVTRTLSLTTTLPPPVQLCGLENYQTSNLTQTPYWYFYKENNCFPDNMTVPCNFSLAFCQALDATGQPFGNECDGAGACLQETASENKTSHNIGSYTIKNTFQAIDNGTGFFHGYPDGDPLDCGNVHTLVYFVCNNLNPWIPTINAPTQIPGDINVHIISHEQTCVLNITVYYAGACAVKPLPVIHPDTGLSTGSILLIVFFTLIGFYFLVGIIVNKVQGHQGVEVLPHNEFWCSLPGLISDGMSYVWSVITCRNTSDSAKHYETI